MNTYLEIELIPSSEENKRVLTLRAMVDTKIYNNSLKKRIEHYNETGEFLHGNVLKGLVTQISKLNASIRQDCDVKSLKATAVGTKRAFDRMVKVYKGRTIPKEPKYFREEKYPYFKLDKATLDLKASILTDPTYGIVQLDKIACKYNRSAARENKLIPVKIQVKGRKLMLVILCKRK